MTQVKLSLNRNASLAYFSKITLRANSGVSTWGPNISDRYNTSSIILPETYSANLIQYVSPKWLFNATLRYNVWNPQKALYLFNTAEGNVKISTSTAGFRLTYEA